MVAVVQLVEHLVVVQDVAGSSPVSHPKRIRACGSDFLFLLSLRAYADARVNTSAGFFSVVSGSCVISVSLLESCRQIAMMECFSQISEC